MALKTLAFVSYTIDNMDYLISNFSLIAGVIELKTKQNLSYDEQYDLSRDGMAAI